MTAYFRGNFNDFLKRFDAECLDKMLNSALVSDLGKMRMDN